MSQGQGLSYYETAGHVVAAAITLALIDLAVVPLKFWVRRKYKQPLMADDWLLIPALISMVVMAVAVTYGATNGGIGTPLELPEDFQGDVGAVATKQVSLARKIQWAFVLMYPLAIGFVKASFLFLYKRVFTANKKAQKALIVLIALVGAWTVAFFFAELFQCSDHFSAAWGSTTVMQHQCHGTVWMLFGLCLTDLIFDLIIIILPIPLAHLDLDERMQLADRDDRTVVASGLRFGFVLPAVLNQASPMERFRGITKSLYWGTVEAGVAVFVACLPTLQYPLRKGSWRSEPSTSRKSSAASSVSPESLNRAKNGEKSTIDAEQQL